MAERRATKVAVWTRLAIGVVIGSAGNLGTAACGNDDPDSAREEASSTGELSTDSTAGRADETATDAATEGEGPWPSLEERPCPDDSFLTYESFGGPFMLTYCTGCHHTRLPADQRQGAPIEVNFDDLEDIRERADRIWGRAGDHNATMPPVGAAPEGERALLGEWLACGTPTDADLDP